MTDETPKDLPARLVPPLPGAGGRSHWVVTPYGLQIIEELAGRGCHVTTIARVLGMHAATLRDVRKRDEAVDEAYQRGLAREHDALVGNLRTAAEGGNVVANMFLLKTRHLYREGEPLDGSSLSDGSSTGGVIVVPQRMDLDDFLAEHGMRDVTPDRD